MKLLSGYILILLVFFIVKEYKYLNLQKTTGIVVGEHYYIYSGLRNLGNGTKIIYPIAKFKGPTTRKKFRKHFFKPENGTTVDYLLSSRNIQTGNLTEAEKDSILKQLPDTIKLYVDSIYNVDEYTTVEPTGSYFFKRYKTGELIDVIYENNKPDTAIVNTLFSYWITIPALYILVFLCILWTGVYNVLSKKYA